MVNHNCKKFLLHYPMINLIREFSRNAQKPVTKYSREGFLDKLRIFVKGGDGGNGYPKYGGVGGQGGDVTAVAVDSLSLEEVSRKNPQRRFVAQKGRHSTHNFILGVPGENLKIRLPVGISMYTDEGKKLGELNEDGEEIIIARGGTGGHPKNGYLGIKGQGYPVLLELKLIADVGLVGFPNAGKSTLLKAISHANPKIANYPFTTIKPNIGMISYPDHRQISMADLPGLIEGAHANYGMGHQFLRHVERTKLLVLIVDINGFKLGHEYKYRSCLDTLVLLNKELELYNPELLKKPALLLVNKMDKEDALKKFDAIRRDLENISEAFSKYPVNMRPEEGIKFDHVLAISAKEREEDVEKVKDIIRSTLDVHAEIEKEADLEEQAKLMESVRLKMKERGPKLV